MKESRRSKRMKRQHKKHDAKKASLNMVSLMDIFTILVFFLLVTSAESEVLPNPKAISLPESHTEKFPKRNLVIMVNDKTILVNGKLVANVSRVMRSKSSIVPELRSHLREYKRTKPKHKDKKRHAITIMGDKDIPYRLLKKIMLTCAEQDFSNVSLAVVQKQRDEEAK